MAETWRHKVVEHIKANGPRTREELTAEMPEVGRRRMSVLLAAACLDQVFVCTDEVYSIFQPFPQVNSVFALGDYYKRLAAHGDV